MKFSRLKRGTGLAALMAALVIGAGFLAAPKPVAAHPLGNFTINQHSRLEISATQINVRYVLDLAEIPAFQERSQIDLNDDGEVSDAESDAYRSARWKEAEGNIALRLNNAPIPLKLMTSSLEFPPGQAGLATLRLTWELRGELGRLADARPQSLYYRNDNFADRLGWKEIVVQPAAGVELRSSSARQQSQTAELRAYPNDLLSSPLDEREANVNFVVTAAANRQTSQVAGAGEPVVSESRAPSRNPVDSLLSARQLSLALVLAAVAIALGLGAIHALAPGHGKTIMAAYLVGSRGQAKHAIGLGLTVAASHTFGVLVLALITLYGVSVIPPEQLYPWLGLASGLIALALGLALLGSKLMSSHRVVGPTQRSHSHDNSRHSHTHRPAAAPVAPLSVTWKSLLTLGVAEGLIPSASALIIFLAAVTFHRIGLGLLLIVAFSAGMAATLTAAGLLVVYARQRLDRISFNNNLAIAGYRFMPLLAPVALIGFGSFTAIQAMLRLGTQ